MNALTVFRDGLGSISADSLNAMARVTTLATDLISYIGVTGISVFVFGTHAALDGGQSWYFWDPTALGPTSLPGVIVPTGSVRGAWIQVPPVNYVPPNIAAARVMGNPTGAPEAPVAMTGDQTTALLTPVAGDAGTGGTKGVVPAPPPGSAALHKALMATGGFDRVGYIGVPVAQAARNLPYTLVESDAGETLYFFASGTVTIPAGLTVGDVFDIGWALGYTGLVTTSGGMTLLNPVGNVSGNRTVTGTGFITVQIFPGNFAVIRGGQNVT